MTEEEEDPFLWKEAQLQHLPVRLLLQLLHSVSPLRLSSLPWAAQGTAVHSCTLLPLLAETRSSSEGKGESEENYMELWGHAPLASCLLCPMRVCSVPCASVV